MTNLHFEKMTASDITEIAKLECLIFGDLAWSYELFVSELSDPIKHYLVLKEDNIIIAYGGFAQILNEGHIMNIAVEHNHRKQGIGHKLVMALLNEMDELCIDCATLEVSENNLAAIRMYEKIGFLKAGMRPNYYGNGDHALIYWIFF
ncbi:MAG: ribosomal protein S18-alanine N-acetyltransferase [Christensenellaceae bacterium]|jgi:ribosomal-protein-alanine N-acetyltransferase|nr:ribosomal protein S18-alanine N-acetyltransferase [Christensenellaceae bacterium]